MDNLDNKEWGLDWEEDCLHHHGKVLTGKYRHFCPDFDYLPIDETCEPEFACCLCGYRRINNV